MFNKCQCPRPSDSHMRIHMGACALAQEHLLCVLLAVVVVAGVFLVFRFNELD